jgi:hypothetical protein
MMVEDISYHVKNAHHGDAVQHSLISEACVVTSLVEQTQLAFKSISARIAEFQNAPVRTLNPFST